MAKNIFDLRFKLPAQKLSIKKTASKFISLLEILRKEDEIFTKFKVSALHFKSVSFNLSEGDFENNVNKLVESLSKFALADIKQYEKEENPTIDFSRDLGLRFLLQFNKNNKQNFSISLQWSSLRTQPKNMM